MPAAQPREMQGVKQDDPAIDDSLGDCGGFRQAANGQ
jgi:hypothetical protein